MPDYRLTIEMKDVAEGDVANLAVAIMNEHGEEYDASRGDFAITASKLEGSSYFPVDLEREISG